MSLRAEFVMLASREGANVRDLCRRYGISAQAGYKWLRRARSAPEEGFADRSRRPHSSPGRTAEAVEAQVLALRQAHPSWGGRKLARRLRDLGEPRVPAASTITEILRRHERLDEAERIKHRATIRFERPQPNELWQMDFKGHFAHDAGRCHPLTLLDDCSRFSLCLEACADERGETVADRLVPTFERYGLPCCMLFDNGAPWGHGPDDRYTPLVVWLLRLGIAISHSRPYHPQTLGKDERFHRSLKAEVLQGRRFRDLEQCQSAFTAWRQVYNLERPHEALDMAVPASRYQPSARPYPASLPTIEYAAGDRVRKVQHAGRVDFMGRTWRLPRAFRGYPVAFRPTAQDGLWKVFFMTHEITQIDLRRTEDQ
jgi:transposase InsO family protein